MTQHHADPRRRRAPAAFCIAALLLALAGCGGGSGGSSNIETPPPPPEATEYRAEASVRLEFSVRASAGAAPLRYALATAPAGMSIDETSGRIEWVPQAAQLGPHGVTVSITDAGGATETRSYRVTVDSPAGLAPWIVLDTEAGSAAPAQAVRTTWRIGGEIPANATLQILAHAPAVDATAADASPMSWWLDEQGAWSTGAAGRGPAARDGELRLTVPRPMPGLRVFEMRLLDDSGRVATQAARRLLVADGPALRLVLNRPLANTLDRVKAELDLAVPAGGVRLAAWLVQPDGTLLGLPGMTPGELEVRRGDPVASGRIALLDREFIAGEEGDYRIHARLYAAADGRLLAEASRRFDVCDTPGSVSGVVRRPDGTRVDGTLPVLATVNAFDLDDRAVTASTPIAADGSYRLELPPGRYVLGARVLDLPGTLLAAEGALLRVGCTPAPATADLLLSAR